jgi:hypothetical protein
LERHQRFYKPGEVAPKYFEDRLFIEEVR